MNLALRVCTSPSCGLMDLPLCPVHRTYFCVEAGVTVAEAASCATQNCKVCRSLQIFSMPVFARFLWNHSPFTLAKRRVRNVETPFSCVLSVWTLMK
jgi:hypothetical protein